MQPVCEAEQLVRSYNIQLENTLPPNIQSHDVRRIFIDNERQLQNQEIQSLEWRTYYEPWKPVEENTDPTTKVIREQAVLLSHAWKVFRETIPKSEQENLEGKIPSVEGLIGIVAAVARDWQNKRTASKSGKYMKYFTSFCETLDAHSYMLEVLPNGNEYVSLFTGSLKTIINASSNYEKIAQGLGNALSEISVHVVACQKEVRLHQTKAMQEKIALLYAHVFLFIEDTMKWYLKKPRLKLRDAFRENFYDQFKDMIVNIQELSKDVFREANLASMAETRQIRQTTEETLEEVRLVQIDGRLSKDSISREQAEIKRQIELLRIEVQREGEERRQLDLNGPHWMESFRNNLFSQVATGVRQELLGMAQKAMNERSSRYTTTKSRQLTPYVENFENYSNTMLCYERDNIILNSNHLLNFFSPTQLHSLYQRPFNGPIFLKATAAYRLKEWTTATSSNSLFISVAGRRPKGLEAPQMTILASLCVDFIIAAKLPVISYFISTFSSKDLREGNTQAVQAMLSVTYALIRQFIELLPAKFTSLFDFSQDRLLLLDGTLETWTDAIRLLRDLVEVVPKPLFCIIDGFQLLDDWSTEKYLADLLEGLRSKLANDGEAEGLKVLITTTGRSRALIKILEPKDLLLADQDGAVDSPVRRGGERELIL